MKFSKIRIFFVDTKHFLKSIPGKYNENRDIGEADLVVVSFFVD